MVENVEFFLQLLVVAVDLFLEFIFRKVNEKREKNNNANKLVNSYEEARSQETSYY